MKKTKNVNEEGQRQFFHTIEEAEAVIKMQCEKLDELSARIRNLDELLHVIANHHVSHLEGFKYFSKNGDMEPFSIVCNPPKPFRSVLKLLS